MPRSSKPSTRKNRKRSHGKGHQKGLSPEVQEAMRRIESILSAETINCDELRKEVAERGAPARQLRRRVWPLLLDVNVDDFDEAGYLEAANGSHRDSSVVEVDVQRSLWAFTANWPEAKREASRQSLKRLLNATVGSLQDVYYYQGLHDIASVLLLILGEHMAYAALRTLTTAHLRDFTRPTLEPVKEVLELLHPLLAKHDRQLHDFIECCEERQNLDMGLFDRRASRAERQAARSPPYFAIAWVITWFSHSVQSLPAACRLFDLFFASHPLMPLYVATVSMSHGRQSIMECGEDDFPGVHSSLKNLDIFSLISADQLAQESLGLFRRFPPSSLRRAAKRRGLHLSSDTKSAWVPDSVRSVKDVALPSPKPPWEIVEDRLQFMPSLRSTAAVVSILGLTLLSVYQMYLIDGRSKL
mmetsp:Transcript_19506/g.54266  ORF Transcript_19506/g.54266 Transcript_19506/m.54266 type:complete len:415 (+) Transcript_19506:333-1577(+)